MTVDQRVTEILTDHDGYWRQLASLLRAMENDSEAARAVRRQARNAMGCALLAGYEGSEPTPTKPRANAVNLAQEWVGARLLSTVGPQGLSEADWVAVARVLTRLAGPRISERSPQFGRARSN